MSLDRRKEASLRIEVKGRHGEVTDEVRRQVERRFARVGRQVSSLAVLEVELREERNPSIANRHVAEATLKLKGVTLRAHEAAPELKHAINELADDLRRQVKRHREKRRRRWASRRFKSRLRGREA